MRRRQSNAEIIPRYGRRGSGASYPLQIPGHIGSRPLLSLVLNVLSGKELGVTALHLSLGQFGLPAYQEQLDLIHNDPRALRIAQENTKQMMRFLADLWIDSGKSGLGNCVDNPSKRHVELKRSEDDGTLCQYFYQWLGNEMQYPQIRVDGTQTHYGTLFGFDPYLLEHNNWNTAMEIFGRKVATYWFFRLLDSPYSRHLARCDECKRYFAYQRAPKTDIKSGVYCPKCKQSGSVRRVKSARIQLQGELIDAASLAWGEWRSSHTHPDQREWIATRVSKQFSKRLKAPLTRKWVSQNIDLIQAAIKRRTYAKG